MRDFFVFPWSVSTQTTYNIAGLVPAPPLSCYKMGIAAQGREDIFTKL
jgi:hypothetical protein